LKNPTNIEEFGHLEYKITPVTEFENIYTSKLKMQMEFLGEFLIYTSITSRII